MVHLSFDSLYELSLFLFDPKHKDESEWLVKARKINKLYCKDGLIFFVGFQITLSVLME